jgi:tungstate transport system substrate-binding protein
VLGNSTGRTASPRSRWRRVAPAAALATLMLIAPSAGSAPANADPGQAGEQLIRVATIPAATTGGLLPELVAEFEEETGYRVQVEVGNVFARGRAGDADLVIVHWGAPGLESFVRDGFGEWPLPTMANAIVFVVPPGDPAKVTRVGDPADAFARIAATGSPFIVNDLPGITQLNYTLGLSAGRPVKGVWYQDLGVRGQAAVDEARRQRGYTLWGLHPFLERPQGGMRPALFDDVLMQAVITSVVVDSDRFPDANAEGAMALQAYLLEPATQAHIRAFPHPQLGRPIFWPAAEDLAPST